MISGYKRGEWKTEVTFTLNFDRERDFGYSFPCDEGGKLLPGMEEPAKKNHAWCLEHPEEFPYRFNEVVRHEKRYRGPDTGTCSCGERIEIYNQYMGACICPKCGQWYNVSGQELLPPDKWGWDGTPLDYE